MPTVWHQIFEEQNVGGLVVLNISWEKIADQGSLLATPHHVKHFVSLILRRSCENREIYLP